MIVKCQRSLVTTEPDAQLLVYNEDRSRMWRGPINAEWDARFGATTAPDDNRFFAEVRWLDVWLNMDPPSIFVRRLPEQGW